MNAADSSGVLVAVSVPIAVHRHLTPDEARASQGSVRNMLTISRDVAASASIPAQKVIALSSTPAPFGIPVAWQHAERLMGDAQDAMGIACTASLASVHPKRGTHRCRIAMQTEHETRLSHLTLSTDARSRAKEEVLVADLILAAAFEAAGLDPGAASALIDDEKVHAKVVRPRTLIREVWAGSRMHV